MAQCCHAHVPVGEGLAGVLRKVLLDHRLNGVGQRAVGLVGVAAGAGVGAGLVRLAACDQDAHCKGSGRGDAPGKGTGRCELVGTRYVFAG